ncbi:hypothetical protein GCM10027082_39470 [Comamonas humi]
MKQSWILAAALVCGVGQAYAGPHFVDADASVNSNGMLSVSFDEAGLGNASVLESLSADTEAVYACINGGGKHPKASNKTAVSGEVLADVPFNVTKNGRVRGSIQAGPPSEGDLTCPGGQELMLACVKYVNVLLTDTTNNISIVPDGTFSRSFLAIPDYCPN